ncbi:MAG: hypothetical protein M3417_00545 [Actinomycetota bacterium]|nr:hypothetical protein [Actinomycetota bacterium]
MASSHADTDKDKPDDKDRKHVPVVVVNEDDGDQYKLNAKQDDTLASVIAELFEKKLKRERRTDDRLRCESGEEDVLQYETLTFKQYLDTGHCPGLTWLFAAGTGGA